MIRVKRVYDPANRVDGFRILVDRLWPRGLAKDGARLGLWLKEIAPSDRLRKWYGHDPRKGQDFRRKYQMELKAKNKLLRQVKQAEKEHGRVTLLFAAKDAKRNNAFVLLEPLRTLVVVACLVLAAVLLLAVGAAHVIHRLRPLRARSDCTSLSRRSMTLVAVPGIEPGFPD